MKSIPYGIADLDKPEELDLDNNPLHFVLAEAYEEGIDAVQEYLRQQRENPPSDTLLDKILKFFH